MPDTWDAETYRARARQWREEADALPPGAARDACILLADGYAKLARLIEREKTGDSPGTPGS
ncbi:MAG TPA: hypothetical protein VGC09_08380 [Rhodopila sp.]